MSAAVTWISGAVVRCAGVCRGSLAAERWRWAIKELFVIMNKYGHSKPFKLSFTVPEVSPSKMEPGNLETSMQDQKVSGEVYRSSKFRREALWG